MLSTKNVHIFYYQRPVIQKGTIQFIERSDDNVVYEGLGNVVTTKEVIYNPLATA